MNLPNRITLSRIFMIPVFVAVFYLGELWIYNYLIAAGVFMIAGFTDAIDGHIARSRNLVTDLGKFLDPIADKVLVSSAFIVLLTKPMAFVVTPFEDCGLIVAGVCVAVILARELIVSGFRIIAAGKKVVLAADKLGKYKTTFQDASIALLLACMPFLDKLAGRIVAYVGLACFVVCTLLTLISGIHYLVKNKGVLKDGAPHEGEGS